MYCSLQGFQSQYGKVLKEIAIAYDEVGEIHTRSFQPPFEWTLLDDKSKRTNWWLTKHYHGLEWDEGRVPYHEMKMTLCDLLMHGRNTTTYVAGLEQVRWLRDIMHDCKLTICDLQEEYGCPSFRKLTAANREKHQLTCYNSDHHSVCARKNAQLLQDWFWKQRH